MPKISKIDEVPCQAEVRILQKITLKNLNFVCRSGMHIETLPVPKTDSQLLAEVAVT